MFHSRKNMHLVKKYRFATGFVSDKSLLIIHLFGEMFRYVYDDSIFGLCTQAYFKKNNAGSVNTEFEGNLFPIS